VNTEHSLEWQFGGWHNLNPLVGWSILLVVGVATIAATFLFYRNTLKKLTWQQRLILAALRCGFLLALVVCLAGPARVERVYDTDQDARPLAVIVDRSQSMSVADSRGTTRLAEAVRVWKKVDANAVQAFPSLHYFRFSTGLVPASDLESAVTDPDPGPETHLYDSLNQALKQAPPGGYGGVVCLTDGLDTTDSTAEELSSRALQNHTPLYFAVGQNQQAARETLLVRELSVPGQVLRKSRFTATVLVEAHSANERDVPLALTMENHPLAQTSLHLHVGVNLIPWSVPVDAGEPGLIHLTCSLGDGAEQESTAAVIPVVGQNKINVLFYQGTLNWNYRFINNALESDSSFAMTGLFNQNLNLTQVVAAPGQTPLTEMPGSHDGLDPFQIVVLSDVRGDELTNAQQSALLDYVHGGGGLLFLVSDNAMARTFSGTPLESVLPVVFEAPPQAGDHNSTVEQFQQDMQNIGGSNTEREDEFVVDNQATPGPDPLSTFALPPNPKRSQIAALFSPGGTLQNMPQFAMYARVQGIKAGAEVLAVHPTDKTDDNESRALLVTQRFGEGQVTVLLTDALWRWRLSLPSTSHDPEVFWQQLFLALARHEASPEGLRLGVQPFFAALGQMSAFRLDGAQGADAPTITAISPAGTIQNLTPQAGPPSGSWSFQFSPFKPGKWRIRAQDDRGAVVETLLRVSSVSHASELSGMPPDTDGLRKLADETGGYLLNDGAPDSWSAAKTPNPSTLVSKHSQPLWNNWAVLLLGLGFYTVELLWRRQAKLL
jgi:uncharacterized membrane protein